MSVGYRGRLETGRGVRGVPPTSWTGLAPLGNTVSMFAPLTRVTQPLEAARAYYSTMHCHRISMETMLSHWFLMIFIGFLWFSLIFIDFHWFSRFLVISWNPLGRSSQVDHSRLVGSLSECLYIFETFWNTSEAYVSEGERFRGSLKWSTCDDLPSRFHEIIKILENQWKSMVLVLLKILRYPVVPDRVQKARKHKKCFQTLSDTSETYVSEGKKSTRQSGVDYLRRPA